MKLQNITEAEVVLTKEECREYGYFSLTSHLNSRDGGKSWETERTTTSVSAEVWTRLGLESGKLLKPARKTDLSREAGRLWSPFWGKQAVASGRPWLQDEELRSKLVGNPLMYDLLNTVEAVEATEDADIVLLDFHRHRVYSLDGSPVPVPVLLSYLNSVTAVRDTGSRDSLTSMREHIKNQPFFVYVGDVKDVPYYNHDECVDDDVYFEAVVIPSEEDLQVIQDMSDRHAGGRHYATIMSGQILRYSAGRSMDWMGLGQFLPEGDRY